MATQHCIPLPVPPISPSEDRLLSPAEVSQMLSVRTATLRNFRKSSSPVRGPRFVKIGSKSVRYKLSAVAEWLAAQESRV
jgi:predicted DNA-binding transcriptional regulator AlpA